MKTSGVSFSGYAVISGFQNIEEAREAAITINRESNVISAQKKEAKQINEESNVNGNAFWTTPFTSLGGSLIINQKDNDRFRFDVLPSIAGQERYFTCNPTKDITADKAYDPSISDGSWKPLVLKA